METYKYTRITACIVILFYTRQLVSASVYILQADNQRTTENHEIKLLPNASNGKCVVVTPETTLSLNLCLRSSSIVSMFNLRFSYPKNTSALLTVSLDNGKWFGTYYAHFDGGWNDFVDTGEYHRKYNLESGWHVLKIDVSKESSPVAVDNIAFDVKDPWITEKIFTCETTCIPTGNFPPKHPNLTTDILGATLSQKSKPTTCAEVDNIDLPLYHPYIRSFLITASLPQYHSYTNRRSKNVTNCRHLSPTLWSFNKFIVSENFLRLTSGNAVLTTKRVESFVEIVAIFRLDGQRKGSIDAKIGSELYLKFKNISVTLSVEMQFGGETGKMSNELVKTFSPKRIEQMWKVPDFTWTENGYNFIVLYLKTDAPINFDVDYLRLVKRPMVPEHTEIIYKSDDVIIEAVIVEFWWLAPESMTIKLSDGKTTKGIAYLRFYRPVPWTSGYAQVFVLYQDGNARLLPVTPEGLDWIPFGTSVIIGQTESDSERPYLNISEVTIDPEKWSMNILYKDGGNLKLRLHNTQSETQALVTDVNFARETMSKPFATIRSMHVTDGNADVDTIKVDNSRLYSIMGQWGDIQGKSFAFFRRCISSHLTLGPDIQIDVIDAGNHQSNVTDR